MRGKVCLLLVVAQFRPGFRAVGQAERQRFAVVEHGSGTRHDLRHKEAQAVGRDSCGHGGKGIGSLCGRRAVDADQHYRFIAP